MAEDLGQSRTEAPTPRRRQEAREQGRVAVSQELTGGLLLLAGALALLWGGAGLGGGLLDGVRRGLSGAAVRDLGPEQARALLVGLAAQAAHLVAPLLAALFVVALVAMVFQVGFHFLPGLLAFRIDRLDPMAGLQRMFSLAGVVRGLAALAKVMIVAAVAYVVCSGRARELSALWQHDLPTAVALGWAVVLRLAIIAAIALLVLGGLDYAFQRYRLEQSLWMTRQELKEELKQEEGDPVIKARMRKLGREMSQRRMMRDVPRATVVITNPTHLAIALRYEKGQPAPRVLAKGAGHVAQRIVETARRHAVPVVERRPVAQALYKAVKVGQEVPAALYHAVAEVLAYVYRLRGTPIL
jgi:flagellar biosynthetic protein FlhB